MTVDSILLQTRGTYGVFIGITPFNGALAITLEKEHLPLERYVVCEKSDGERVSCIISGGKVYFQTRNGYTFYHSNLDYEYEDVRLDGEWVIHSDRQHDTFLIFDRYAPGGLEQRMTFIPPQIKGLRVIRKTFYPIEYIYELEKWIKSDSYPHGKTDGYIFTPLDDEWVNGTHSRLFKYKPAEQNTIDLEMDCFGNLYIRGCKIGWCKHNSFMSLAEPPLPVGINTEYYPNFKQPVKSIFGDHNPEWVLLDGIKTNNPTLPKSDILFYEYQLQWGVAWLKTTKGVPTGSKLKIIEIPRIVVECKWNPTAEIDKGMWVPIAHRKDKTASNAIKTINNVIQSIHDNITLSDLTDVTPVEEPDEWADF